jgi:hypothetical protein
VSKKIPPAVREYFAKIGRKGGANGRGKPKPRKKQPKKQVPA